MADPTTAAAGSTPATTPATTAATPGASTGATTGGPAGSTTGTPPAGQLKEWQKRGTFALLTILAGIIVWGLFWGRGSVRELKTQLDQEKVAHKAADEAKTEAEKKAAAAPGDQSGFKFDNLFKTGLADPKASLVLWSGGGYMVRPGAAGFMPSGLSIGGPIAPTTDWSSLLDDYQKEVARANGLDPAKMGEDDVRVFHIAVSKAKAEADAEKMRQAAEEAKAKAEADLAKVKADLENEKAAKVKAEKAAEVVDKLKRSLKTAEKAKAKAEADAKKASQEFDQFKVDKAKAESAEEKAKLEAALGSSRADLENCLSQLEELRRQFQVAQAEAAEAKAKAEALEKKAATPTPPAQPPAK